MKKNYVYALMSAVALVGAVSLSACSTSDDVVDVNPTFDGEAVKTQFTISFTQSVAKTRQTAGTVQNAEDIASFRGMDNIVLYPFAATAAAGATDPIISESTKLGDAIKLSNMIKPTTSTAENTIPAGVSGLTANNNSVLFNDVTIPIGTGSFLFYGKAIDASGKNDFYNGSLTMTQGGTPNPANIFFDLDQIYPSTTTASTVGANLADYLTTIAQAQTNESTPALWSDCAEGTGLGDLYKNFITLKAGSSLTVQAAVQDLYSSVRNNTDEVSKAIVTAITNSTYVSSTEGGVLTFTAAIGNSASTYFPGDVNLPDGAALLTYDKTNREFSQVTTGDDNSGLSAEYADYVYPASLYYYCNSGIGTATTSQSSEYKSNVDPNDATSAAVTWGNILNNYTAAQQVKSNTRSVAILDPIQYAVGRLDMKVIKLPATMYDKKGEAYNASAGFDVTGVLIGGQRQVKFDFTPNTTSSTVPEKTIYDNITQSQSGALSVTQSDDSGVNYTLALETVAADNTNADVYVAVEFKNNGADFEGIDGVIPAGCKFYLVGKLSPSTVTGSEKNPKGLTQVFKQDYKTIANFSIASGISKTETSFPTGGNTKGLGAAYNTVPDLRTPQLELGLSVDLHWETGITFDVEF